MFKFSLKTVLEVRERFEKIKYKEYSKELLEYQKLDQQMQELQASLTRSAAYADQAAATSPSPMPALLHQNFHKRMKGQMEMLAQKIREQNEMVDQKRKELVEARRSHRALEILQEKEKERYQREQFRLERAAMDEIASNHYTYHR